MTVRILQGDCRDVLKTLPDESVHCVVTSPPYWGMRDYGVPGQIGNEPTPSNYVNDMHTVFNELHRVLRNDGTVWLNLGDSYGTAGNRNGLDKSTLNGGKDYGRGADAEKPEREQNSELRPKNLLGVPWRVALRLQEAGWYLRQDIIWHKPNPMPESVSDRCTKSHEYIFLLTKAERYYFNAAAIAEKATTGFNGSSFTSEYDKATKQGLGTGERKETDARNKRSVWTVSIGSFDEAHFATFPPALIEPCILAGCPEGGTVLDPFGGAGTTGLVADRHHRDAILIELNPEYAAMAKRRIEGDAPLFAEVTA